MAQKNRTINPILVLAGAAAKNGNGMFAADLIRIDRGSRDCKAMRKRFKAFQGLTNCSIAAIVDSRVKHSDLVGFVGVNVIV